MSVSQKAAKRLTADWKSSVASGSPAARKKFLDVVDSDGLSARPANSSRGNGALPLQLATYGEMMRRIEERLTHAFGPSQILVSETSQLPFPPTA